MMQCQMPASLVRVAADHDAGPADRTGLRAQALAVADRFGPLAAALVLTCFVIQGALGHARMVATEMAHEMVMQAQAQLQAQSQAHVQASTQSQANSEPAAPAAHSTTGADGGDAAGRSADEDPTTAILRPETAFGAYSGVSYTHNSQVTRERPGGETLTLDSVGWDGLPFRNPIYYGLRIAHWIAGMPFGGMIDFTHAKAVARLDEATDVRGNAPGVEEQPQPVSRYFDKLEFSHGHNLALVNGVFRLPFATASLSPYVGVGAGVGVPHVEIQDAGKEPRTYGYQVVGWAAQGLIGVELRFAGTSLFMEYKFSYSPYHPQLTDGDGGEVRTNLATQHVIGGFLVRMGH